MLTGKPGKNKEWLLFISQCNQEVYSW